MVKTPTAFSWWYHGFCGEKQSTLTAGLLSTLSSTFFKSYDFKVSCLIPQNKIYYTTVDNIQSQHIHSKTIGSIFYLPDYYPTYYYTYNCRLSINL
jgi:hypothetical protein